MAVKSCVYSLLLGAALSAPVILTGCRERYAVGYRVRDPYYNDYHRWDQPEIGYYNAWVIETHRPHREFRRLSDRDRREYWEWRHRRERR